MNKKLNLFLALTLVFGCCASIFAQDQVLESQRKELKGIKPVPGQKLDHKGIIINPTPQEMAVNTAKSISIGKGFNISKSSVALPDLKEEMSFLNLPVNNQGIALNITQNSAKAEKEGVKNIAGAYKLTVGNKGVDILSYDSDGTFYALQTLKQILESPVAEKGKIPYLSIKDYPDLPIRGTVEGFYGNPWSHETRLSLIDFLGKNKMNYYVYGPKDDPYHSSPNWRKPYPEKEAQAIKELVDASNKNHVNFVWAIHPGQDIKWNDEDYNNLINKFNMMYDLGVRAFAIFFDDIEGEGTDSRKQTALLNNLTNDFVKAKGDVADIMICPTDYTELWANPDLEKGQLAIYGETLNPNAEVFWTGQFVCSDLTPQTLEFVDSRIKRPALYWWNFPVTDYARYMLMQGPAYGLDNTLTADQVSGVVSNPMEHGEASKLALYGVGDYTWNVADYNPIDNWERGLVEIAPEAPEAYRTFAIHNADTGKGYRRDESWETPVFSFNNYTPEQFDALKAEFENIVNAAQQMQQISNKPLLNELQPWLTEFGKLGERGLKTLELIKIYEGGDEVEFLNAYINNTMSPVERDAYNAHRVGTLRLQPFYENVMTDILQDYNAKKGK
ncbi:MAG: beta-N-acetylglucosaminidase domain-containing protein [Muribaculaceae bacterium]|nr:beta-N-acetylglucosaminidase domain-containing protein [Muribaculaceae bacterium]